MERENKRDSQFSKELVWEMICRRLKKKLPEKVMKYWEEKCSFEEISDEVVSIFYPAAEACDVFLAGYQDTVAEAVCWAIGRKVKVEFHPKEQEIAAGRKRDRKFLRPAVITLLCICLATAILAVNFVQNRNFEETFYQIGSKKINETLRIIQLSDLHNSEYGEKNEKLIKRVGLLKPDIIILSGDIVDKHDNSGEAAIELCRQLVKIAPVYYIYGNHEEEKYMGMASMDYNSLDQKLGTTKETRKDADFSLLEDDLRVLLEAAGVNVLWNESASVDVKGITVDIYGILTANPLAFWDFSEKSYGEFIYTNPENLKVLVSHEPYIFETFNEGIENGYWADLVLCGHTHGGNMRLPYIGGVYEMKNGLFPELLLGDGCFMAGEYDVNGYPLIVSRGLTNRDLKRINNKPELVIVDIDRY